MSWTKVAAESVDEFLPDEESGWAERNPGWSTLIGGLLGAGTGAGLYGLAPSDGKLKREGAWAPAALTLGGGAMGGLLGYLTSKGSGAEREYYNSLSQADRAAFRQQMEELPLFLPVPIG